MRRVGVWIVALVLGSWASVHVGSLGGAGLAVSMLVFAFVAVSIVTAMETLFPSLRPRARRTVAASSRA